MTDRLRTLRAPSPPAFTGEPPWLSRCLALHKERAKRLFRSLGTCFAGELRICLAKGSLKSPIQV